MLEPICEAKFHHNNYGFRPNRGTKEALAVMMKYVNQSKLYYIVDIDIKGFFDNVNHGKLLKQIWAMGIRDKRVISIISKMLKAEIKGIGKPEKGTPQGGILSPLLSNIVLNELDWWISDQWETFKTKHDYTPAREINDNRRDNGHKYRALRTSKMKEVYIVRYADDFKLICRSKNNAKRIFEATKMWLKERLDLEISEEKSKIVDIRRSSSEFLGFRLKAKMKRNKYVVQSNMTDKAIKSCKENLCKQVVKMSKYPTAKTVMQYNAMVLGMQNYYKAATNISIDMRKIAFRVNKKIQTRLKRYMSKQGFKSLVYKRAYTGNFKEVNVAEITLFPIANVKTDPPYLFNQKICDYTKNGREVIHKSLSTVNPYILKYIMNNSVKNRSIEYNDNRISLYVGQNGKCGITGELLEIGNMHVHHKTPRGQKGSDEYKNLVFVTKDVHMLLHVSDKDIISEYLSKVKPDDKTLKKINKFRRMVGNSEISKKI